MKVEKILVPVDFYAHSLAALELAKEYAETFDSEIHLLHVVSDFITIAPPYGPVVSADLGREIECAASEHLDQWREAHCPVELKVTSHVRRGVACSEIISLAADRDADLIIMGTRGLTGLRHVVMGSVAERTVRSAACPVLTTKAEFSESDRASGGRPLMY